MLWSDYTTDYRLVVLIQQNLNRNLTMADRNQAKPSKDKPIEPSDIERLAYRIWFNDIPVYDPRDGLEYRFLSLEDVESIVCGPGEMWTLQPPSNNGGNQ